MNARDPNMTPLRVLSDEENEDRLLEDSYWALLEYARRLDTPLGLPDALVQALLELLESELAEIDAIRPLPLPPRLGQAHTPSSKADAQSSRD